MNYKRLLIIFGLFALVSAPWSLYQVTDNEHSVQFRANQLPLDEVGSLMIKKSGLYFKIPFLDHIIRWDTRIQQTLVRKLFYKPNFGIWIDYRLSWRIRKADQYVNWVKTARMDLPILFTKWVNEYFQEQIAPTSLDTLISQPLQPMKEYFSTRANMIGLEILDLSVIQKSLSPESRKNTLSQMRQQHSELLNSHLRESQLHAQTIQSRTKTEQALAFAQAVEKAEKIKNEGDTTAMQLYHDIYSKEPKFAAIYQRFITYRHLNETQKPSALILPIESPKIPVEVS